MAKRMCKICEVRPATVPDRNQWPARPTPAICSDCHAERLGGDLRAVLRQSYDQPGHRTAREGTDDAGN